MSWSNRTLGAILVFSVAICASLSGAPAEEEPTPNERYRARAGVTTETPQAFFAENPHSVYGLPPRKPQKSNRNRRQAPGVEWFGGRSR